MTHDAAGYRRAAAVAAAIDVRTAATHAAEVEYSETVAKLRERFEADLAEALCRYRQAVLPAHRAFNASLIGAELAYLQAAALASVPPDGR